MLARNVMPALVPLLVAVAIGVTLPSARRLGAVVGAALFAYSLGFCVWAGVSQDLQRPDWSAVAAELGEPEAPRATVTWALGEASLRYYLSTGAIQVTPADGYDWLVHEIDFVSDGEAPPPPARLLGPGFREISARGRRPTLHQALRAAGAGAWRPCACGNCARRVWTFATTAFCSTASGRARRREVRV